MVLKFSEETRSKLIERYVTGIMDEDKTLGFEIFILPKTDWQTEVGEAAELFNVILQEELEAEVQEVLKYLEEGIDLCEIELLLSSS